MTPAPTTKKVSRPLSFESFAHQNRAYQNLRQKLRKIKKHTPPWEDHMKTKQYKREVKVQGRNSELQQYHNAPGKHPKGETATLSSLDEKVHFKYRGGRVTISHDMGDGSPIHVVHSRIPKEMARAIYKTFRVMGWMKPEEIREVALAAEGESRWYDQFNRTSA